MSENLKNHQTSYKPFQPLNCEWLVKTLQTFQVSDAVTVYELLLEKKKVVVPVALLQGLLELLAYNSEVWRHLMVLFILDPLIII